MFFMKSGHGKFAKKNLKIGNQAHLSYGNALKNSELLKLISRLYSVKKNPAIN